METKTILKLIVLLLISIGDLKTTACTSFAVYSTETWYGMNFDYSNVDIRFYIQEINGRKVFQARFSPNDGYIAGMNDNGLFNNYQLLYYNLGTPSFNGIANPITISELNDYSRVNLSTVDEITTYLGNKKVVPSWDLNLHTLFADATGNAMVVEPFGTYNGITPVTDSFLVMANFPVYEFIGRDYTTVSGVGSERYIAAYEYITEHKTTFGLDDGLETLSRTAQIIGNFPTQVSLLFNPVTMEIYFCMHTDFLEVWKISLYNETIETFRGFNSYGIMKLDGAGIWSYDLWKVELSDLGTGLNNPNIEAIKLFPNPTGNNLNIEFESAIPGKETIVEIYNIEGKLIFSEAHKNVGEIVIDISGFPKGIYLAKLLIDGKGFCEKILKN